MGANFLPGPGALSQRGATIIGCDIAGQSEVATSNSSSSTLQKGEFEVFFSFLYAIFLRM
jgi:hypothetical protein